MDYVILGSTGLLGKTLLDIGKKRNLSVLGLSRNTKKYKFDFLKINQLLKILKLLKPKVIINAAGIVDIDFCEKHFKEAELVNSLPLKHLAKFSKENNIKLVQISTDHFFSGDKNKKHKENNKITILNNYAKTKLLAEQYSKLHNDHIVVRTNFTGLRKKASQQTFLEWILQSFKQKKTIFFHLPNFLSGMNCTPTNLRQFRNKKINIVICQKPSELSFNILYCIHSKTKLNMIIYLC